MSELAEAVLDCSLEYEVTRAVSVDVRKGRKTDVRTEKVQIDAAITPITGQDLKRLGEGFKVEGTIMILTPDELFTSESSSCRQPDKVNWHGADYQISMVKDWTDQGGFFECVGMRINR